MTPAQEVCARQQYDVQNSTTFACNMYDVLRVLRSKLEEITSDTHKQIMIQTYKMSCVGRVI